MVCANSLLGALVLGALAATTPALAKSQTPSQNVQSRAQGCFFGALVADALCLGSHYEYDAKVIKQAYGGKTIQTYLAPGEQMGGSTHGVGWGRRNYHPGQKKGDNTDNGLYNEMVLKYFSESHKGGKVDLGKLVPTWQKALEIPEGKEGYWGAWRCTQTKQALAKVQQMGRSGQKDYKSLGGGSNAMAVRGAALPAFFPVTKDLSKEDIMKVEVEVGQAAKDISFTHMNREALLGAEFFARVSWRLVYGLSATPRAAMEDVRDAMNDRFVKEQVRKGFEKFAEVIDPSRPLGKEEFVDDLAMTSMARLWDVGKSEPIKVGKASPTEGTMPSSIYMILKFSEGPEKSFTAAARANAMVGGDNASRSVAVGTVLGAWFGVGAIGDEKEGGEKHLKDGLNAWGRCEKMLKAAPVFAVKSGSNGDL